jgi:cyclopropane fatty-acyl-phospholipid synthase-like methyltransferase
MTTWPDLVPADSSIEAARTFVGTTPLSGFAQLALVRQVGIEGTALLEIGCGTLHFAKALLAMHRHGIQYCGIDPNYWLRLAALGHDSVLAAMVDGCGASFDTVTDFDGRKAFGQPFDFVFSHSVLSHVGHDGLQDFLAGAANSLRMHGRLLASVNIASDKRPTIGDEWTYPSGVTISPTELRQALIAHGFTVNRRSDLRELYMSYCPSETHDWIVAEKVR